MRARCSRLNKKRRPLVAPAGSNRYNAPINLFTAAHRYLFERGEMVREPLLLQYYQLLPAAGGDGQQADGTREYRKGLSRFKRSVQARYNEATLQRLLRWQGTEVRQAAVLALGLVGTMKVNPNLAACLHDDDRAVRRLAGEAMWSIWFRADAPEHNAELQRIILLRLDEVGPEVILADFEALLRKAPRFAEAYNQRGIFNFRCGGYARAAADCDRALRLNPCHFGAASGLGQCFMKQKKLRAALRSFRRALRINPNLDGVRQTIASIERLLGEEGKR
jgi:tetratricopeptide (TPR) repeat protein